METLLKSFLTLTLLLGTVFGTQNLLSQSNLSSDTIRFKSIVDTSTILMPDTVDIGKVLRVIYKDQPGVFLTNEQELITLAKFQWKEIYKLQAQDFRFENYKLRVDLNDANKERDRYKQETEDAQNAQLKMSRSYENAKIMLDTKTRENAVNESLKVQFKKESRVYKICTYALMGVVTYLVVAR